MADGPTYYGYLTFNSPLSCPRADAMVRRLAASPPATVLDVGCGWGELLLRVAAAAPGARGLGLDTDERMVGRAQVAAREAGLADRVEFRAAPAVEAGDPTDLVLCVGSSHALADELVPALVALRQLVRPGGRLLLGEGFWEERGPVDRDLVWEDVLAMPDLGGLVDAAVSVGFRPLYVEVASTDEWDAFESGYLADSEEWLLTHVDDPRADAIRAEADEHRRRWLHGYRHGLGFGYLTLGVPT